MSAVLTRRQYQLSERGYARLELAYDSKADRFALYEPQSRSLLPLPKKMSGRIHRWLECSLEGPHRLT